jgi:hypothetical protein
MSQTIFSDSLGYEGKVTLTLKSNNRVLKSKTYKNKGTAQLFKFLGYCLIDSYEDAKNLLPAKLLLLYNHAEYRAEATPTNVDQRSTWQTFAKMPTIISENESEQVKVVYSFEIPRAAIDERGFNQIALYGAGIEDFRDFSAFYYLVDDIDEKLKTESVQGWSTTTILLIEWELSLSNKNVEANNN